MKLTVSLGQFEQLILTAVMVLQDDAYGMQIHSKVCELADREMSLGSVYVTLDRLQKKGYVSSKVADGGPERGGKPRRFYSLRPAGEQALRESVETATRISESCWSFGKWKLQRTKRHI
jgi:PadR family transcriptional regulator PadR